MSPNDSPDLRIKHLEEQVRQYRDATVRGLNQLLDLRDINTGCHSTRLAEWAVRVAVDFGLDEDDQHNVEVACLLHDIGKVGVPDSILGKRGALSDAERLEMNRHPEYGWAILRSFPGLQSASLFALHHHERFDGKGYPGGLKGDQIPLGARIVTVVDSFDAMVSDRCYRKGMSLEIALDRLTRDSGKQFDPEIVEPFVRMAEQDLPQIAQIREPDPEPAYRKETPRRG